MKNLIKCQPENPPECQGRQSKAGIMKSDPDSYREVS